MRLSSRRIFQAAIFFGGTLGCCLLRKVFIVVKMSFFDVEGYKYLPLRVSYAQVLTFEYNSSQFYLGRTSASLSHRNRKGGCISVALPLKNLLSV